MAFKTYVEVEQHLCGLINDHSESEGRSPLLLSSLMDPVDLLIN